MLQLSKPKLICFLEKNLLCISIELINGYIILFLNHTCSNKMNKPSIIVLIHVWLLAKNIKKSYLLTCHFSFFIRKWSRTTIFFESKEILSEHDSQDQIVREREKRILYCLRDKWFSPNVFDFLFETYLFIFEIASKISFPFKRR